jgi:flavin reductase (DIM6/NTAB) family NADH-FMN oxidoreductase RutF
MTIIAESTGYTGIESHDFLALLRRQASTVTVVTASASTGGPAAGFTATSFTSVSLRPQLVSFCVNQASSSWPTVRQTAHVGIHLLAAGQHELARTFAARGIDRFADLSTWRPGPYGVPQLNGVLATLICAVVDRVLVGDHAIVIGRPVSAQHRDGAPLLYHGGGYTELGR